MPPTKTTNELMDSLTGLTTVQYAKLAIECAAQADLSAYQLRKLREELERTVDAPLE